MTKHNPYANSLAKPQYRQRVKDTHKRGCSLRTIEYEFASCGCMDEPQLEGWQETPRQMEG